MALQQLLRCGRRKRSQWLGRQRAFCCSTAPVLVLFVIRQHASPHSCGRSPAVLQCGAVARRRCKRTISLRMDSLMRAPTRRRSPDSAPPPIQHRVPALWKRGDKITRSSGVSPVQPMVCQPHLHAAQHIQQQPDALPHLVSGFAQPRVARRREALLGLRELLEDAPGDTLVGDVRHIAAAVSTTPPSSALDSASRRIVCNTSAFGCCSRGNRTICRAAVGVNPRPHDSSRTLGPQALDSAPVGGTPNSCAVPITPPPPPGSIRLLRTSAWIIQASSSSRVRPPARFSP